MKKLQIVMLALLAVFAFGATIVAPASAETTLLANWLANAKEFTGNKEIDSMGSLVLGDSKVPIIGSAEISCTFLFTGTVNGASGTGSITKIFSAAGKEILAKLVGEATLCTTVKGCESSATDIEAWPIELPYALTVFLMENGEFLLLVSGTEVGYELNCLVLGVKTEDKCNTKDSEIGPLLNVAPGVEVMEAEATPAGECAVGGANSGKLVQKAGDLITLIGASAGETLTVSSEGE